MDIRTILAASAVLIAVGGILERFRRQGRDINGIGKKQQAARDEQDRFERSVVTALIRGAGTQEDRDWLAEHFRE